MIELPKLGHVIIGDPPEKWKNVEKALVALQEVREKGRDLFGECTKELTALAERRAIKLESS